MKPLVQQIMLIGAIILGSFFSFFFSVSDLFVSASIICLLFFIFYSIPFDKILFALKNRKYFSYSWMINFIIIPTLAIFLSSLFVRGNELVVTGLLLYLIAPCTDWVLGFTKLAKGDVMLNTVLLPINLISQIILLPVYLFIFSRYAVTIPLDIFFETLFFWIVLPFLAARITKYFLSKYKTSQLAEWGETISILALLFFIFNSNFNVILEHISLVPLLLLIIFLFFVIVYYIGIFISKIAKFNSKETISLAMTTAARNAPLMLGISLVIFPTEALIHTVLIVGMLLEFPHLIILTYLFRQKSG
jgi:ACR3 family arsenite transporter